MPWKVTAPMQERIKFIEEWLTKRHTMVDLCRKYGVTRKTGYKWVQRFKDGGTPSLCDASRAPLLHPNATDETMVELVIGIRRRHPRWAPRSSARDCCSRVTIRLQQAPSGAFCAAKGLSVRSVVGRAQAASPTA
jgi:transposase-like protein